MIYREDIRLKWSAAVNKYFTVLDQIKILEKQQENAGQWKNSNALNVAKSTAKRESQFWDEILFIIDKNEEHEKTINDLSQRIFDLETVGEKVQD